MRQCAVTLGIMVVALLSGCAATRQATDVQPSGFLADARALLRPGTAAEEALLVSRHPAADWAAYDRLLLEPVTIWEEAGTEHSPEAREDLQRLADGFSALLAQKLSQDYTLVEHPAPGTLRLQAAITHGEASRTALAFASKAIPQARLANTVWAFGSGKPAFAGEITLEVKIQDAHTGELLAAEADRRVGGTKLFDTEVFNAWGDVQNSLEFWADAAVYRLCVVRGGANCVKPKA